MADLSDLLVSALLKGGNGYESNPLYKVGASLIASPPISPEYRMSPWERLAAGLTTGFGGSLLQSIARSQDSDTNNVMKLAKVLQATPEERDQLRSKPGWSDYADTADAVESLQKKEKKSELSDYFAKEKLKTTTDILTGKGPRWDVQTPQGITEQHTMTVDPETGQISESVYGRGMSPGQRKLAEALAEKQAGNITYGGPFDPVKQAAIEDSMRGELKHDAPTDQFLKGETAFQNMLKAFNSKGGASDLDLLYGAVQTREPGLAVRSDDQSLINGSYGIGGVFATAAGYLQSGRKFPPQMRAQLVQSAGNARDARIELLKQDFGRAAEIAQRRKIDPENIVPFNIPSNSSSEMQRVLGGELWEDRGGKMWFINKDSDGNPVSRTLVE